MGVPIIRIGSKKSEPVRTVDSTMSLTDALISSLRDKTPAMVSANRNVANDTPAHVSFQGQARIRSTGRRGDQRNAFRVWRR